MGHGNRGVAVAMLLVARDSRDPSKVLHVASPDIDTLDPQQYADRSLVRVRSR